MCKISTKALMCATVSLMTFQAHAALTKFLPNTYVSLSKAGDNTAAKTYYIGTSTNPSSSAFTLSAPFTLPYNVNGIGLNATDSLLYGATWVGTDNTIGNSMGVSLYRIGANGQYQDMGLLPTPGTQTLEYVNFSAGTIYNGAYYYTTYGFTPTGVAKLAAAQSTGLPPNLTTADIKGYLCWLNNVAGLSPTPGTTVAGLSGYYQLDFSNPVLTAALQSFLDQINSSYPNIFNADGGIQDIDINPSNGLVYAYISYPQGGTTVGRPVVFNAPASGVSSVAPVGSTVNTAPGQETAGIMFDPGGSLYSLFTTGDYAGVNLSTGALTNMTMSNVPTSGGNLRGDLAKAFTVNPLPLDLMSFKAARKDGTVAVQWKTTKEEGVKMYVLEYSTDARNWQELDRQQAQSMAQTRNTYEYSYTQNNPAQGINYYRLNMIDQDAAHRYSNIVQVMLSSNTTDLLLYPVPATNTLYLSNGKQNISTVYIYDLYGRKVLTANGTSAIDLSRLAGSTYILEAIYEDGSSSKKQFTKQ